ncbi:superinfection immunity protein [Streptomyces sp. NPDC048590]|uniref:superinfection immunity protein n=1 Tax=Streptomyces sp. NPDC048590 TaxID=3365574 RepID=UPI003723F47C
MLSNLGPVEVLVLLLVSFVLLCVPTLVARRRGVEKLGWVVLTSALGAFTGVFWIVSMVLAFTLSTRETGDDSGAAPAAPAL